jgi:citrate lyase subunit beta/citryl-CoA lyase
VRIRRCAHFVPGANDKMLAKALDSAADALVLDLEDAVLPERKDDARTVIAGWLADVDFGGHERVVRINPVDTPWFRADVEATMVHPPDAYLCPRCTARATCGSSTGWSANWSAATATRPAAPRCSCSAPRRPGRC